MSSYYDIRYTNWEYFSIWHWQKRPSSTLLVKLLLQRFFWWIKHFKQIFWQFCLSFRQSVTKNQNKKMCLFVASTIPKKKRHHGLFSFQIVRTTKRFWPFRFWSQTDVTKGAYNVCLLFILNKISQLFMWQI